MDELAKLPNIGKVNAKKLCDAGVTTPSELAVIGATEAFLRVRERVDNGTCLNMLYSLEGAIRGVRWHDLDTEVKAALKEFYCTL